MPAILILEDQEAVSEIIKINLEDQGFKVFVGKNGNMGLEILKKVTPEVIILDILMPEMDGYQFYKKIKANEQTSRIPVLVMTVRGAMKDAFLVLGVDSFLAKPFLPDELISQVKALIPTPAEKNQSKKIALVAGSDNDRVDTMRQQLKKKGYAVETVSDGPAALEKALKLLPQLFVLQFDMPGMDADTIVQKLRREPKAKNISVVVYSPLKAQDDTNRFGWERFLNADSEKDLRETETPIKIIEKFDKDSFLDKIKDFL